MEEGGGSSELEYTSINAPTDALDGSTIFHLVFDFLGFILYMHQQIPKMLQDITREFDELRSDFKELETELAESEAKPASTRRKQAARKREVKMEIKRLEKMMACITNLKTALQLVIAEVPNVTKISLVLGPSPLRPVHIYELNFSNGRPVLEDFSRSKIADNLSKKTIRTMVQKGVGSNSYAGPTKLFVLVKAPSCLNLPMHFLPKRDFRPNRKTKHFRLRFRCKTQHLEVNPQPDDCASSVEVKHSTSNDLIWFQCRHTIKGLPSTAPPPED